MRDVSLNSIILTLGVAFSGSLVFFLLARFSFKRAWGEFRLLRQERLARAMGLLSPELETAHLNPFRHLPAGWVPEELVFSSLPHPGDGVPDSALLFKAIQSWEDHHRSVSHSFLQALGHAAHHRLAPHAGLHSLDSQVEPIGDVLLQLVDECPEPTLQKELRLAYSGLKTGAAQNLEYVSRRMRETAHESHSAFHQSLGHAQSEFERVRESLIQSICREADDEIEEFMAKHRGFRLNPWAWGRQIAYYREFEQLRNELEASRKAGQLGPIALIVVMIVEDENRFVRHLRAAVQSHDELHQRLSDELRNSAKQLSDEAESLSGWASLENQRLQSTVSHQLILHMERSRVASDHPGVSAWIARLALLRDRDPELAAQAA